MRRWLLLVLSVALAVLVFAPVAAARGRWGLRRRGHARRGADDGGFDDRGCMPEGPTIEASMTGG